MAAQFTREGRGEYGFVSSNGTLLQRTKSTVYSPNYPKNGPPPGPPAPPRPSLYECPAAVAAKLAAGDTVRTVAQAGPAPGPTSTAPCVSFTYLGHAGGATTLGVNGYGATDATRLCIGAGADAGLVLGVCGPVSAAPPDNVGFHLDHNYTAPHHAVPQAVVHIASSMCIALADGATVPRLVPCSADAADQMWVYGSSGRLCQEGRCISVGGHA
jgi:hypothetical protein